MGAPLLYGVRLKRAFDRGVVPHMGIPNESRPQGPGINRYETALLRQATQTLFILDACGRGATRPPSLSPARPCRRMPMSQNTSASVAMSFRHGWRPLFQTAELSHEENDCIKW